MKKSLISSSRGFTLIELLVVIAIIGTLASIVLASLDSARSKGRDANRISQLKQVQTALELYYDDNRRRYPLDSAQRSGGTDTTYELGDITSDLVPRYLGSLPIDPTWGNAPGGYRYAGAGTSYTILVRLESNASAWCEIHSPAGDAAWSFSPC